MSGALHARQRGGRSTTSMLTWFRGTSGRSCFSCPTCPPGARAVGFLLRGGGAAGPSLDGGCDEFRDERRAFFSRTAIRARSFRQSPSASRSSPLVRRQSPPIRQFDRLASRASRPTECLRSRRMERTSGQRLRDRSHTVRHGTHGLTRERVPFHRCGTSWARRAPGSRAGSPRCARRRRS